MTCAGCSVAIDTAGDNGPFCTGCDRIAARLADRAPDVETPKLRTVEQLLEEQDAQQQRIGWRGKPPPPGQGLLPF